MAAKYAALFEIVSDYEGTTHFFFKGPTAKKIIQKFDAVQNIPCLIEQGRDAEDPQGQEVLDQLEAFYQKYLSGSVTFEDLQTFHVSLSIGSIRCACIAAGDEEIADLQSRYPKALRK